MLGDLLRSDRAKQVARHNTYAYVEGNPLLLDDPTGEAAGAVVPIVRACLRFPEACAALLMCRSNPVACKQQLCKASSAVSRYKPFCDQAGCTKSDSPLKLGYKTSAACTCFVNRVFEKYVCRSGKSDPGHDKQIEDNRTKCLDCAERCVP